MEEVSGIEKKEGGLMSQNASTKRGNRKKLRLRKSWLVRLSESEFNSSGDSYMPNSVSKEDVQSILASQKRETIGGFQIKIKDIYPNLAG